jgi:ABC-type polysaccharide/polyol phosphate transport system ATPase subunit
VATTVSPPGAERTEVAPGAPPAVRVERLSKCFRLPHQQFHTLKQRAIHPFAARTFDELRAVDDVSFEVAQGEFFGIVGRNGSGKSTLLKCLAGIYGTDAGRVEMRGRLSPFIELGVGFHQELTARDNVMINAIMLGLSRKQARERFDEIIAFAELEEFVDLKLKNYSSGMTVRLGFAVAVQVDADILLVDEVLAVGDASFQQKCFDQFESLKAAGRTILFVTHDMSAVRRFCDRAMLIERGETVKVGDPEDVSRMYSEINFGSAAGGIEDAQVRGAPQARVLAAWCEDAGGERVLALQQGQRCVACAEVEFLGDVEDPVFAMSFRNDARHTIYVPRSDSAGPTGAFRAGQQVTVRFTFSNWLAPSRYTLTPLVLASDHKRILDTRADLASLIVDGQRRTGGVADIPVDIELTSP